MSGSTAAPGPVAPGVDRALLRRALANVLLGARHLDPARLAAVVGCSEAEVGAALEELVGLLRELGLEVVSGDRGVRLERTAEMEDVVERYRGGAVLREETHLTLQLLAKLGPSTMPELAKVRRVDNVRDAMTTLLEHQLVEESGRRPGRGRPIVYRITEAGKHFLEGRAVGASVATLPAPQAGMSAVAVAETPVEPDIRELPNPARLELVEEHTYLDIEVALQMLRPRIWRRFLLRTDATFEDLDAAIKDASEWLEPERPWYIVLPGGNSPDAGPLPLTTALRQAGDQLEHVCERSDEWTHEVLLRGFVKRAGNLRRHLVDGRRAYPPEDCRTAEEYLECVKAAQGKGTVYPDIPVMIDIWDPEEFDLHRLRKEFDR